MFKKTFYFKGMLEKNRRHRKGEEIGVLLPLLLNVSKSHLQSEQKQLAQFCFVQDELDYLCVSISTAWVDGPET